LTLSAIFGAAKTINARSISVIKTSDSSSVKNCTSAAYQTTISELIRHLEAYEKIPLAIQWELKAACRRTNEFASS
jgi:hypothetical protein